MANEIQLTFNLQHQKNPKIGFNPGRIQFDQVGEGVFSRPIYVGETPQAVTFTGINTPHTVIVWNIDEENAVAAGVDAAMAEPIALLRPRAKLPLIVPWYPGATLWLQAELPGTGTEGTGTFDEFAKVHIQAYED